MLEKEALLVTVTSQRGRPPASTPGSLQKPRLHLSSDALGEPCRGTKYPGQLASLRARLLGHHPSHHPIFLPTRLRVWCRQGLGRGTTRGGFVSLPRVAVSKKVLSQWQLREPSMGTAGTLNCSPAAQSLCHPGRVSGEAGLIRYMARPCKGSTHGAHLSAGPSQSEGAPLSRSELCPGL